ncbi:shikimate dehydrogenase [Marinomonas sp. S3726]|uniref:acetyltransferase n=1 Tax=Marinomonas sp. S3726 TaxID=579484 RepID=UPI0005F9FFDD|nr:acetyltransferase [Marinomonas sp. S3726]KJZ15970.1 shikimate dehydrogenase [Marinomonas sp. S3726]
MSDEPLLPIVIIGGGGHASVITEILLNQGREIIAVVSPEDICQRSVFKGIIHLKKDEDVLVYDKEQVLLVNGIGIMPKSSFRREINEYFLALGYRFETVVASNSYVSPYASIDAGAQVLPMAIIQTGATVGSHSIINTGALIEHDCRIGSYNHIAPKATLCGQVETKDSVYVGAGSIIIQKVKLELGSIIGAGAVVTKNIAFNKICYPSRSKVKSLI